MKNREDRHQFPLISFHRIAHSISMKFSHDWVEDPQGVLHLNQYLT